MSLTLNQIVQRITDYGAQHHQIQSVKFGEIYNWLSDSEIVYPSLFFNVDNANVLARQTKFIFSIYIMDRQLQESNGLEVMSDTTLIGQDIIALLRDNNNPWIIDEIIPLEYFVEGEPDYLAGVRLGVGLTISNINNRCEVPIA
jgi:hypothetical protein